MRNFEDVRNQAPAEEDILDHGLSSDGTGETFAFPLSPAQERMWYAIQENPGNSVYNGSFRWILEGPLQPKLVERTFAEMLRRHEALRTRFAVVDGNPVQVVYPHLDLQVEGVDLRKLAPGAREQEIDRLCAAEACRPFDLENDPLIRVGLLQTEDERHILMLTVHHLVSDGWSIGLIMEEFQQIYGALAAGREPALPVLPIQYADYAVWKNEQTQRPELREQLTYWTNKLGGYRKLEVPGDLARPGRRTTNAAIVSEMLPRTLTNALREFSNQHGGTMFTTSLAACMTLLQKYAGSRDIAVGSPLAGRNRTDVETLIGLFVNHVVLRAAVEGDPTFIEFADRVRDTVWEAFAHQDIPFENVLKALRPSEDIVDAFREPFFLINFICQREYGRAAEFVFEFAGIRMSTMPSKSQGALYDLNFFLVEREAGWRLSIEYNTDLYSENMARQMLSDFHGLLDEIARDPKQRLSRLSGGEAEVKCESEPQTTEPLETSAQSDRMAETGDVYAMPASMAQERFWLLSKLTPGNPAFHMPACVRLKGHLSTTVLEQSFRLLAARHEILRTSFEENEGTLTQVVSPNHAFKLETAEVLGTDQDQANLQRIIRREAEGAFDLQGERAWRVKLVQLGEEDHILVITLHHIIADGWSHNIVQQELWTIYEALSHNQQPTLPELPIQYGDFAAWQKEWVASEQAQADLDFWIKELSGTLTALDFPTDQAPRRRLSVHGGLESLLLPQELTAALKSRSRSENVTSFVLFLSAFVTLLSAYANQPEVILGSPVANRRTETEPLIGPFAGPMAIRVKLPEHANLLEILWLVRDTALNALSHAELPFEVLLDKLNVRPVKGRNPLFQFYFFYQTAFLQPRRLTDLTITPLPTLGLGTPFEMQMGVVERAEGVRLQLEYNADLFEQSTIQRVLSDFCKILRTMAEDPQQRANEIGISAGPRAQILEKSNAHEAQAQTASNDTERRLTAIWQELLGVQNIARNDNYFELGGNSLGAVRLFSEIQKEFNVHLPLATLFEAQTIAELAGVIRDDTQRGKWSSLVRIQTEGVRPPFFCIHGGGGNVLIYRALSKHLGNDQPFYGLQSQGLDGGQPLLARVEEMAELYVREIRRVQPTGPYYLGGYCMGGTVALEMAQQLLARGEKVGLLAMFDTANWSAVRKNGFAEKIVYQAERIMFHFLNFGLLDFKDQVEFVGDKVKVLLNRTSVWRGWLDNRMGSRSESALLARIWEVNDQAILEYRPKFYAGTITDFRPVRQYSQYLGEPMQWGRVAQGHEVVPLRVYPAGMLVEPFVKDLAQALRKRIDDQL